MMETGAVPGQVFASVWDVIEEPAAEAATIRLRSEVMMAVQEVVASWGVVSGEAARRLGITQQRLNELLRGRIDRFSLDALAVLATRARRLAEEHRNRLCSARALTAPVIQPARRSPLARKRAPICTRAGWSSSTATTTACSARAGLARALVAGAMLVGPALATESTAGRARFAP